MLINADLEKSIYIVGTGICAQEIQKWIKREKNIETCLIERQHLDKLPADSQCILGFASREYRRLLFQDQNFHKFNWISLVHPNCHMDSSAKIGSGTVIWPMAFVGFNAIIGTFGWINPFCLVSHNDQLGNNVVLGPGTKVAGSTTIGDNVNFGMNTTVCDKISICSDCDFLTTSVVTKDILHSGKYFGNRRITIDTNK